MVNYVVITDYIENIIEESRKVFKGNTHEADWVLYHDALSLMRAKECKKWIKERDYLKLWILFSRYLFDDASDLKKIMMDIPSGITLNSTLGILD